MIKRGRVSLKASYAKLLAGSLAKMIAIILVFKYLGIFEFMHSMLDGLRSAIIVGGLQMVDTYLKSVGDKILDVYVRDTNTLLLLISTVIVWIAGSKLINTGWKGVTSNWRFRSRLILLAFNIATTVLWAAAVFALIYPTLSKMLGVQQTSLEQFVNTVKGLNIALLAFILSALTPAVAGLINIVEERGAGKVASFIVAIGGLVYGYNAWIMYNTWQSIRSHVTLTTDINKLLNTNTLISLIDALKQFVDAFNVYLKVALVAYGIWVLGFTILLLTSRRS